LPPVLTSRNRKPRVVVLVDVVMRVMYLVRSMKKSEPDVPGLGVPLFGRCNPKKTRPHRAYTQGSEP